MKLLVRGLFTATAILILGLSTQTTIRAQWRTLIQDRFASVNGLRLHYLIAGKGEPMTPSTFHSTVFHGETPSTTDRSSFVPAIR